MEKLNGKEMLGRLDVVASEALSWLEAFFKSGDETEVAIREVEDCGFGR